VCGTPTASSYCRRCNDGGRGTYRWRKLRAARRELDEHRCVYCGVTEDLTVDLDPRLGGDHRAATLEDCVTACRSCNARLG
jgi:5-methylcytosine-specific restriction endonuclease McrA